MKRSEFDLYGHHNPVVETNSRAVSSTTAFEPAGESSGHHANAFNFGDLVPESVCPSVCN